MLRKSTFGCGKAELYLVDTLNELARPKATAKCMAMISSARAWCQQMYKLRGLRALTDHELAHIVRLQKTDHATRFKAFNAELDESLTAWTPVLTDDGYVKAVQEARAYKLAMNIATGAFKELAGVLSKAIVKQDSDRRKLQRARSQSPIETAYLELPAFVELKLLDEIFHRSVNRV